MVLLILIRYSTETLGFDALCWSSGFEYKGQCTPKPTGTAKLVMQTIGNLPDGL